MKKLISILLFLAIIAGSYFIRKNCFNNKVGDITINHSFLLTTLEIWDKHGACQFSFAPVQTFQNKGDKYIAYYKRLEDKKGNNYYVSFPPMSFLLPHAIINTLQLEPQQKVLQHISFFLHIISGFAIFGICNILFHKKWHSLYLPSLFGFISFLFIPSIMQMHTWNFFAEMNGQVFYLISLFFLFKLFSVQKKCYLNIYLGLYSFSLFLLIYSEWIGIFFASTVILISLLKKKNIVYKRLLVLTFICSCLAVVSLIIHYSQINGFANLLQAWKIRFIERTGFFGNNYSLEEASYMNFESYKLLLYQVHSILKWFGYLVLALIVFSFVYQRKWIINSIKKHKSILLIIALPLFVHLIIFFNANVLHYACIAKFGILISIGLAVFMYRLRKQFLLSSKKITTFILVVLFSVVTLFSTVEFVNASKKYAQKNELQSFANYIRTNVLPAYAIFIKTGSIENYQIVYLCYLSKRNMMLVESIDEAKRKLKANNKKTGVFIMKKGDSIDTISF